MPDQNHPRDLFISDTRCIAAAARTAYWRDRLFLDGLASAARMDPPTEWPEWQDYRDKVRPLIRRASEKLESGENCHEEIAHLKQLSGEVGRQLETIRHEVKSHRQRTYETVFNPFTIAVQLAELESQRYKSLGHAGGAKSGGVRRAKIEARDIELAKMFQQRRQEATCSDTALMERIAEDYGMSRSAGIEAIKRGLKKLR